MARHLKRVIPALLIALLCRSAEASSFEADFIVGSNAAANNVFIGKTGIGTNNPVKQLHVVGDSKLQGGLTVDGAFQVPRQGDIGQGPFTNGVSDQGIVATNIALHGAWISYGGANQGLYVSTNGNVGVGTSTPSAALEVNGDGVLSSITVNNSLTLGGETRTNWPNHITDAGFLEVSNTASWASNEAVAAYNNTVAILHSNTTYTVTNGTTGADIQAMINSIPKELNSYTATLQFSPGVYTSSITLGVFVFKNGFLNIQPSNWSGVGSLSTNQTVTIYFPTNTTTYGWQFGYNAAMVNFNGIKVQYDTSAVNGFLLISYSSLSPLTVDSCWFKGSSTARGYGVIGFAAEMQIKNSAFDNLYTAVNAASASRFVVSGCQKTNTAPALGTYNLGALLQQTDGLKLGATEHATGWGGLTVTNSAGKIL